MKQPAFGVSRGAVRRGQRHKHTQQCADEGRRERSVSQYRTDGGNQDGRRPAAGARRRRHELRWLRHASDSDHSGPRDPGAAARDPAARPRAHSACGSTRYMMKGDPAGRVRRLRGGACSTGSCREGAWDGTRARRGRGTEPIRTRNPVTELLLVRTGQGWERSAVAVRPTAAMKPLRDLCHRRLIAVGGIAPGGPAHRCAGMLQAGMAREGGGCGSGAEPFRSRAPARSPQAQDHAAAIAAGRGFTGMVEQRNPGGRCGPTGLWWNRSCPA